MEYIPPLNGDTEDPDRSYANAVPGVSEGSRPDARAMEHPLRELVNLITAAGLAPDEGDLTQVYQAIAALIAGATGGYLPLAGGTLTGALISILAAAGTSGFLSRQSDNTLNQGAQHFEMQRGDGSGKKAYLASVADAANGLSRAELRIIAAGGGILKTFGFRDDGGFRLPNDPLNALDAASKQYVDAAVAIVGSLGASGWVGFPNGFILQWGTVAVSGNNNTNNVTFPVSFNSACYAVEATYYGPTALDQDGHLSINGAPTTTGCVIRNAFNSAGNAFWFAIGK